MMIRDVMGRLAAAVTVTPTLKPILLPRPARASVPILMLTLMLIPAMIPSVPAMAQVAEMEDMARMAEAGDEGFVNSYRYYFVRAQKVVVLSAEVNGLVTEVAHEPQDYVHKGDLLVQLDDEQIRLEVEAIEAQIELDTSFAEARIRLEYAEENLAIVEKLFAKVLDSGRVGTRKELSESRQSKAVAELGHRQAELNMKLLRLSKRQKGNLLQQHSIHSPINGVVVPFSSLRGVVPAHIETSKRVEAAEMVQAGQPVTALMKVDRLRISLPYSTGMLDRVRLGQRASVFFQGMAGEGIPAKVVYKDPTIASTGQFNVEVEFTNPPVDDKVLAPGAYPYKFRDGMKARVELQEN